MSASRLLDPRSLSRSMRSAGALLASIALCWGSAKAAEMSGEASFDIAPQDLAPALIEFSDQTGVQVITAGAAIAGLRTPGVRGVHRIDAALRQLLQGTSMTFQPVGGDTVALVRSGSVAPDRAAVVPGPRPAGVGTESTAGSIEEIQVTGSRIARRDLQANSPIVTVDADVLRQSATFGVESVLTRLPQFVPTATQFLTNDIFPSAVNTPGVSTLHLRGLGSNRTLVLIDGRRGQPVNSTLVVDANSIPAAALESVEIISGGASAVYGADAMAGVINFKFKDNFEGASFEARTGITERGDGEENRINAVFGVSSRDRRANVTLGLEWWERSAALSINHPFFAEGLRDPGSLATLARINFTSYQPNAEQGGLPSQAAVEALFPDRPSGIDVNRATPFYFNPDNTAFKDAGALGYKGPLDDGRFKIQPNGVLGENNLLMLRSSPLRRYSVFGKARRAIHDRLALFAQMNLVELELRSLSNPSSATGIFAASIPRDAEHPVPPDLAALLDSRGPNLYSATEIDPETGQPVILSGVDADWLLGRPLDFLPTRQLINSTRLRHALAGLEGRLGPRDWRWEAYISHGENRTDHNYIGYASQERYLAVVQAPYYGRGYTATGPGGTALKCTSGLPIFETFTVSQDCIDAITASVIDRTRLSQDIVEANIEGALFDLPAGRVRGAAGISYRKNDFQFLPDALRDRSSVADVPIGTFPQADVSGSTDVKEVYAELLVPVLRDRPLIHSLELEFGGRYSSYDIAGDTPTYKGLLSWRPNEYVRVRGGYQLANRAPNVNELFLGESSILVTTRGPDPCRADTLDFNGNVPTNPDRAKVQALCSALIGTGTSTFDADPDNFRGDGRTDGGEIELRSGNTRLKSEKGQTYTLGLVLSSPFSHAAARNASLTVDWYRIKISEAISPVTAQTTYDLCFNRDGVSNPTYSIDDPNGHCRRIVRDGVTGNRRYVNSPYLNLGALETSGFDAQLSWRSELRDLGLRGVPGTVSLDVLMNKLITFKSQDYPTQPPLENAGTLARGGLFRYRTLATLGYALGEGHVALSWRHLPSIRNVSFITDPNTPFRGAESYDILYLSGGLTVNDRLSLVAGIDNLLDRDPNRTGVGPTTNAAGSTSPGNYDVLGRRYYAGVQLTF